MSKTISESINAIRESFAAISEVASNAKGKFAEEGQMYLDAEKNLKDRNHADTASRICSFFSDVEKKYSDTSVLSGIRTEIKSEQDKALHDHALFELSEYTIGKYQENLRVIEIIQNNDYCPSNDMDKKAFRHFNDEVRLVNSHAAKVYKASLMTPNPRCIVPTVSREEKAGSIIKELMENERPEALREIDELGVEIKHKEKDRKKTDGSAVGYLVGQTIARVVGVIAVIAIIIAAFVQKLEPWAIVAASAVALVIGALIFFVGGFISGLIFEYIFKLFGGIANSLSDSSASRARSKAYKQNQKRIQMRDKKYNELYNDIAKNFASEIEARIIEWESDERKAQAVEDARVDKSNEWYNKYAYDVRGFKIAPQIAKENYYREIARIAATSAPILTTLLEHVDAIAQLLRIITTEYENIVKLSGASNISRDALTCYYMIKNGEVTTYAQAIQMKKNLDEANQARANYEQEQRRKREKEEFELQAWKEQYRKAEEAKKAKAQEEYKRKMEEYDRREADRKASLSIALGLLAISEGINEHNEEIKKLNKALND